MLVTLMIKGSTMVSDQDRISFYIIKQTSDESEEKYGIGDYLMIQYQILQTNIIRIVCQSKENYLLDLGSKRVKRYSPAWCLISTLKIYLKV